MAEVPVDTRVYLTEPKVAWKEGKKPRQVISGALGLEVRELGNEVFGEWERIRVRATERGYLEDEFRAVRVWTVGGEESEGQAEWLTARREESGRISYGLSNAVPESSLAELAKMKCERHFIECSNQEAKSELGWDELRAQKYSAWEHHLGLVILAQWYIVETRLEWARKYPIKEELSQELRVAREEFPHLSVRARKNLVGSSSCREAITLTPLSATSPARDAGAPGEQLFFVRFKFQRPLAGGLVNDGITGFSQSSKKEIKSWRLQTKGAKAIWMIDNLFKFGSSRRTAFNLPSN